MKSSFLNKILDETVLYVDDTVEGTIEKLKAQSGVCYTQDSSKQDIRFVCEDNGKFYIENAVSQRSDSYYRTFYISGKVVKEDGKTAVKIYSHQSKGNEIYRFVSIALYILALFIYFGIKIFTKDPLTKTDVILVLFVSAVSAFMIISSSNQNKNSAEDLKIMKNEVIKRVEAIKRWDE